MVWASRPHRRTATRLRRATCSGAANATCPRKGTPCGWPLASPAFYRGRGWDDVPLRAHRRPFLTRCSCASDARRATPVRQPAWSCARRIQSGRGAGNVTCRNYLQDRDMTMPRSRSRLRVSRQPPACRRREGAVGASRSRWPRSTWAWGVCRRIRPAGRRRSRRALLLCRLLCRAPVRAVRNPGVDRDRGR